VFYTYVYQFIIYDLILNLGGGAPMVNELGGARLASNLDVFPPHLMANLAADNLDVFLSHLCGAPMADLGRALTSDLPSSSLINYNQANLNLATPVT